MSHLTRVRSWLRAGATLLALALFPLAAGCETTGDRYEDAQLPHSADSADNLVEIEAAMPERVYAGSEFEYQVLLTNISDFMLYDVVMRQYEGMAPEGAMRRMGGETATMTPDYRDYEIGVLRPGQTRRVTVRSEAGDVGTFEACTAVLYNPAVCFSAAVVRPELALTKRGPETALVGETIEYAVTVSNPGVGTARGVTIQDQLPPGLRGADGQRYTFDAGDLGPGDEETFTIEATAMRTGEFVNEAMARSARGLQAQAQQTTVVREPVLTIEKTAPETDYTNIGIDFEILVTNTGSATARNVVVRDEIPDGMRFVEATRGGTASGGVVTWQLGNIPPGEERLLVMTLQGQQPGRFRNCAIASSDFVDAVSDCATVRLEGVSALLIEVVDYNDPIRIGERERYTITVTNQGNRPANDVGIAMILDDRTEFVSLSGPTPLVRTAEGLRVRPIQSLAPGDSATWNVIVQGQGAGDTRFRVRLTAEELNRPVFVAESTRVFE
jgi:uncharacterized repeat protein (TIGR01451 family)